MAEQLTGTVVAEKYRLESLLRSGEVGDFYRGRHLFMDKAVTLKLLPPSLAVDGTIRDLFAAEARSAAALSNPHILAANDFGRNVDGSYYVVYEGFDGEPLANSIGAGGQFSIEHATSIARQIAEALKTADENGFIHGNLTPDSILVANGSSGTSVKVFDLEPASGGLADRSDNRSPASVAFLSPEHFSGLRPVDSRSDIYSLGIVLYQMLAGEVPFKGETPTDVMLKHAEDEPSAISDLRKGVPAELASVIKRALAKDPDDRFQTAGDLIEALDKAAFAPYASSGRFWKTAAAVIVGIGVLASVLIYATSSKQTIPATQLQPDANGQPVQPLSPATGAEEQALASMPGSIPGSMSNTDIVSQPPATLPGGDNYNPWATGAPPPGAPAYVPGGGSVSGDPNVGSPFMPNLPTDFVCKDVTTGEIVPCPTFPGDKPAAKPSPSPKAAPANTNSQAAQPPSSPAKPVESSTNTQAKPVQKPSPAPRRGGKPSSTPE